VRTKTKTSGHFLPGSRFSNLDQSHLFSDPKILSIDRELGSAAVGSWPMAVRVGSVTFGETLTQTSYI
jgi:hypothetical protein